MDLESALATACLGLLGRNQNDSRLVDDACLGGVCTRQESEHARLLAIGNRHETRGQMMKIGKPVRTVIVEPLELPVEQPTFEPEPELTLSPEPTRGPESVPVTA